MINRPRILDAQLPCHASHPAKRTSRRQVNITLPLTDPFTTNNQAERSLRPVVILRKVIHGTRGPGGLENHSVLRSLQETARRQGIKPLDFLRALFTKDTDQAQAALYQNPPKGKPRPHRRC